MSNKLCKHILSVLLWIPLGLFFESAYAHCPVQELSNTMSCDTSWHNLGASFYTNGICYAIATSPSGRIYVGGSFTKVNGVDAKNLAVWDGTSWTEVGGGILGLCYALEVDSDDDLIVGGNFSQAGNTNVGNLAKWDGGAWSNLGGGLNGHCFAIEYDQDQGIIFVGGSFTIAGNISANNIGIWDGTNWSAMGLGLNGICRALLVYNGMTYAGGSFTNAGNNPANRIAVWDGITWAGLGQGLNNTVNSLVLFDEKITVGGEFTQSGSQSLLRIAQWDNGIWSGFGSGFNLGVKSLGILNDGLIVGGEFNKSGFTNIDHFAGWNEQLATWEQIGDGVQGTIRAISSDENSLYLGGDFLEVDLMPSFGISQYDGDFKNLGDLTNRGNISCIEDDGCGNLYIGGDFVKVDSNYYKRVVCWNQQNFVSVGDGFNGSVSVLKFTDMGLYAGGWFTKSGKEETKFLAYFFNNAWKGLSQSPNGACLDIIPFGSEISAGMIVAGNFTAIGSTIANRIARLDFYGSWTAYGEGFNGTCNSIIKTSNDKLIAGGYFTHSGNTTLNHIAEWNGTSWMPLGGGLNAHCNQILEESSSGDIFVGGIFTQAGITNTNYIAKWDGTGWSALPSQVNFWVFELAFDHNGNLFAGGRFNNAGGITTPRIAYWDGSAWNGLGDGLGKGDCFVIYPDKNGRIFAGGSFEQTGGSPYGTIAFWGVDDPLGECCPNQLVVEGDPINAGTYKATQNIVSSKIVTQQSNTVIFSSEAEIDLLAGFEVNLGAAFECNISNCKSQE